MDNDSWVTTIYDHENLPCVKYCNKKWEFFSANTAMEQKPTDVCKAKHNHACEQDYSDRSSKEVRTSQVPRRLLQVLSFKEGDGRMIPMPVKKPKNGTSGVIVHFGHDVPGDRKGNNGHMHVLNVEPPKTVAQETELVAKIKKLSHGKPLCLQHRFCDRVTGSVLRLRPRWGVRVPR